MFNSPLPRNKFIETSKTNSFFCRVYLHVKLLILRFDSSKGTSACNFLITTWGGRFHWSLLVKKVPGKTGAPAGTTILIIFNAFFKLLVITFTMKKNLQITAKLLEQVLTMVRFSEFTTLNFHFPVSNRVWKNWNAVFTDVFLGVACHGCLESLIPAGMWRVSV